MKYRIALAGLMLLQLGVAQAQESRPFAAPASSPGVAPTGIGSLGEVTFALAIVLAAVFAAAWLLRRVRGFGKASGSALEAIAHLPLGPKERAVLLRVGKTQVLVGVAPGRVSTLHVLSEPVDTTVPAAPGEEPGRPTFRSILMRSLGK